MGDIQLAPWARSQVQDEGKKDLQQTECFPNPGGGLWCSPRLCIFVFDSYSSDLAHIKSREARQLAYDLAWYCLAKIPLEYFHVRGRSAGFVVVSSG